MLTTVKVPAQFEPLFQKAQDFVAKFFSERSEDPSRGTIEIFGERYILVRAASMSVDFFETLAGLYVKEGKEEADNIARQLLFDIGHAIGKEDARNFHKKMQLHDPIEKLSAGPIHFAYAGWAFVDIFPESSPSPDENYYLIYDHPYSFESAAWLAAGKKSEFPVCVMNAGYSSGWCEESFGVGLVATEILCQAKGDPACRFIMAPPSRIEGHIADYLRKEPELARRMTKYEVPGFFKRKEAEEALLLSESRFRSLFEAPSDGIVLIGNDRKVVMCNSQFAQMHGYENPDEVIGKDALDFVALEDRQVVSEDIRRLPEEGRLINEYNFIRNDGGSYPVEITASLVRDAQEVLHGIVAIERDISERKRAEEVIIKLNLALEKTVKDRTQQLVAAQEELLRKEKLSTLGQVAGSVGHELRNPLGVMSNAVYYLQAVMPEADATTKKYLNIIKDEIGNADRIVGDLLDSVRIKPPQLKVVEARMLIEPILKKITVPVGINVTTNLPGTLPTMRVDPMQMQQVFRNLIANGIDAMPHGGTLEISAVEDKAHNNLVVKVKDSGIGITPENMAKLFQPLFTTKPRGIGLGLVVVKNLTQNNGGSVTVESEPGKGTTFTVTLPTSTS